MNPIFFISDLHLAADLPRVTQGFFQLLKQLEGNTQALYVLHNCILFMVIVILCWVAILLRPVAAFY